MKINIFKIPSENIQNLKDKFQDKRVNLVFEKTKIIDGWNCSFYMSSDPAVKDIKWVNDFKDFIKDDVENKIYFSAYICEKNNNFFVLSNGKAHFYIRNFCEYNFGLKIAQRVANENDIRQLAVQRFAGKKTKEINSFAKNSKLNNESGESVDYISAKIIGEERDFFGVSSKFGDSLIVSRKDLNLTNLPNLFDRILYVLKQKERFLLPMTIEVKDDSSLMKYEQKLLNDMFLEGSDVDFISSSYDIVGTDFIFSGNERYIYSYEGVFSDEFNDLNLTDLKEFMSINEIQTKNVFEIIVEIKLDEQKSYKKNIKDLLTYAIPSENVIFQNKKWIRFNDEYVDQINNSVDRVEIDSTEEEFKIMPSGEPAFLYSDKSCKNINLKLFKYNYNLADKNFSLIKTKGNYKIEAWDLSDKSGKTVYAIKFGSSQKLVYVCNQAFNTLEIIRNNANILKSLILPSRYCLWLGLSRKEMPQKISQINSIILKQQIDLFARKCREVNIIPVLKFSQII